MSCLFCEIVAGERPAVRVFEDDTLVVFLDLFPSSEGHTLIVPKHHAGLVEDLPAATAARVFDVGVRIGVALKRAGLGEACNLLLNNGKAAWQHVGHVHLHVVPRRKGDSLGTMFGFIAKAIGIPGRPASSEALAGVARRMKEPIAKSLEDGALGA